MTLQEIVRAQTQEIRDTLNLVERKYGGLLTQRITAEESLREALI
jgi:hypothetical protein